MNYDIRHIFVLLRCRECETNELSPLLQMLADFIFSTTPLQGSNWGNLTNMKSIIIVSQQINIYAAWLRLYANQRRRTMCHIFVDHKWVFNVLCDGIHMF